MTELKGQPPGLVEYCLLHIRFPVPFTLIVPLLKGRLASGEDNADLGDLLTLFEKLVLFSRALLVNMI